MNQETTAILAKFMVTRQRAGDFNLFEFARIAGCTSADARIVWDNLVDYLCENGFKSHRSANGYIGAVIDENTDDEVFFVEDVNDEVE